MRQTALLDSLILDRSDAATLKRQLYERLREMITGKVLQPGVELPSTRLLARDLSVARNTVSAAYDQLITEGYLQNRRTARPIVVDLPKGPMPHDDKRAELHRPAVSGRGALMGTQPFHAGMAGQPGFHPGMPDAQDFPFTAWSRLLARRAASASDTMFGTYDVLGFPELREAISIYLNASRGVRCTADQVIITNGAQAAFDLVARLLLDVGDTVWMEEPGYYGAHSAFLAAGATLAPLNVNINGWSFDNPPKSPRVIYVTPSCHHPLGATMRMEQRLRLLEIAESFNAWVIEDDYDSEFRFNGQPFPAMQGVDLSRRVIYVGTFSKMLFPALRLGFMVVPEAMIDPVTQAIFASGHIAPLILQAALADFINEGLLAKHLRRMRRLYMGRRDIFASLCRASLDEWIELVPTQSGLQTTALFRENIDDRQVAEIAKRRGIMVQPLSIQYRHGNARSGLVLGYTSTTERVMAKNFDKLKAAILEAKGQAS